MLNDNEKQLLLEARLIAELHDIEKSPFHTIIKKNLAILLNKDPCYDGAYKEIASNEVLNDAKIIEELRKIKLPAIKEVCINYPSLEIKALSPSGHNQAYLL